MITQTTWKKTSVTTPPLPLKLPLFGPPPHPLGISVAIRGGRGYGYFLEIHSTLMKGREKS